MIQFKTLQLPQIWSLATNCIRKTLENFQVVQFCDGLSLWSIFVVHYSSVVKKDSQHHLGLGSHLSRLFRFWRWWMFSLRRLSFHFRVVSVHPEQCQDELVSAPQKAIWGQILQKPCTCPNPVLKLHELSPCWSQARHQSLTHCQTTVRHYQSLHFFDDNIIMACWGPSGMLIAFHRCAIILKPVVPNFDLCNTHGTVTKGLMNFVNFVSKLLTELDTVALFHTFSHF